MMYILSLIGMTFSCRCAWEWCQCAVSQSSSACAQPAGCWCAASRWPTVKQWIAWALKFKSSGGSGVNSLKLKLVCMVMTS